MTQAQLVKRIELLEQEMATVKQQLATSADGAVRKTARDYIGMFHNDADFKAAMEFGAAYRRSLRPDGGRKRTRKK